MATLHSGNTGELSSFLRSRQKDIISAWERRVRLLPRASPLSHLALVDHVPDLLKGIADLIDQLGSGRVPELPREAAERHALDRLDAGFDLAQVVAEFAALRTTVIRLWDAEAREAPVEREILLVNEAIDQAIAASVDRYTAARNRTLKALDRISSAALESADIDELLRRLLTVLLETTAAVQTAAILLVEKDRLRVRAAVGLEEEVRAGFSLEIGEGFAGRIAAERKSLQLSSAEIPELVKSTTLRALGLRTLYGVPLLDGPDLIGVAHIGSRTAFSFSEEDKRLFMSMAARATAGISQHLLRDALRRRAEELEVARAQSQRALAQLDAVLSASPVGIGFVDRRLRYVRVNDALAAMNGVPAIDHSGRPIAEVIGPELAGAVLPTLSRILETGEALRNVSLEAPPRAPGEPSRWVLANWFPVRSEAGEVLGIGAVLADITDQKREQERLRQLEEKYRALVESVEDYAIFMHDLHGAITSWNPGVERIIGYTRDEFIGRDVSFYFAPGSAQDAQEIREQAKRTGRAEHEGWRVRKNGARFYARESVTALKDAAGAVQGFAKVTHDLTERKANEDSMRESRERLRLVIDALPHIIAFVDAEQRYVLNNHAYEVWFGIPADALRGKTVLELVGEANYAAVRGYVERALRGERITYQAPYIFPGGRQGFIEATYVPQFAWNGRVIGFAAIADDISERKHAEEERAKLLETESRARHRAEEATRLRDAMLAVVSHDLRDPLGTIVMSASVITRHVALDEKGLRLRKQAEVIQRSCDRMSRLINDLVDLAAIHERRLTIDLSVEDPAEMVQETVEAFVSAATERKLRLRAEIPEDIPKVRCDRDRILQVLSNIVGNAVKMTPHGGGILIRAGREEGQVIFSVTDTGPGISQEELARVFERGWRSEGATYKGTGLGLSISRGIVEAHGGRIWAESTLGQGATFFFCLPAAL